MKRPTLQNGFSLVELLVAMAIFSFMLLIVSTGVITVLHMNQASIAARASQQNARLINETIERAVRSASTATATTDSVSLGRLCIFQADSYAEYAVVQTGGFYNLYRSKPGTITSLDACKSGSTAPSSAPAAAWDQLNDSGTQVVRFVPNIVAPLIGTQGGFVTVDLSLTGAGINPSTELVTASNGQKSCVVQTGFQFCSVANIITSAELRGESER